MKWMRKVENILDGIEQLSDNEFKSKLEQIKDEVLNEFIIKIQEKEKHWEQAFQCSRVYSLKRQWREIEKLNREIEKRIKAGEIKSQKEHEKLIEQKEHFEKWSEHILECSDCKLMFESLEFERFIQNHLTYILGFFWEKSVDIANQIKATIYKKVEKTEEEKKKEDKDQKEYRISKAIDEETQKVIDDYISNDFRNEFEKRDSKSKKDSDYNRLIKKRDFLLKFSPLPIVDYYFSSLKSLINTENPGNYNKLYNILTKNIEVSNEAHVLKYLVLKMTLSTLVFYIEEEIKKLFYLLNEYYEQRINEKIPLDVVDRSLRICIDNSYYKDMEFSILEEEVINRINKKATIYGIILEEGENSFENAMEYYCIEQLNMMLSLQKIEFQESQNDKLKAKAIKIKDVDFYLTKYDASTISAVLTNFILYNFAYLQVREKFKEINFIIIKDLIDMPGLLDIKSIINLTLKEIISLQKDKLGYIINAFVKNAFSSLFKPDNVKNLPAYSAKDVQYLFNRLRELKNIDEDFYNYLKELCNVNNTFKNLLNKKDITKKDASEHKKSMGFFIKKIIDIDVEKKDKKTLFTYPEIEKFISGIDSTEIKNEIEKYRRKYERLLRQYKDTKQDKNKKDKIWELINFNRRIFFNIFPLLNPLKPRPSTFYEETEKDETDELLPFHGEESEKNESSEKDTTPDLTEHFKQNNFPDLNELEEINNVEIGDEKSFPTYPEKYQHSYLDLLYKISELEGDYIPKTQLNIPLSFQALVVISYIENLRTFIESLEKNLENNLLKTVNFIRKDLIKKITENLKGVSIQTSNIFDTEDNTKKIFYEKIDELIENRTLIEETIRDLTYREASMKPVLNRCIKLIENAYDKKINSYTKNSNIKNFYIQEKTKYIGTLKDLLTTLERLENRKKKLKRLIAQNKTTI